MNYKKIIILVLFLFGIFTFIGCKEEVFEVTFDTDGGSTVEVQKVNENKLATKPNDPTKEGYIFDNWYADAEKTELYDFEKPVNANLTLYAKWLEMEKFTIKFETNGGTEMNDVTVYGGDVLKNINNPKKEGFTFAGWYTDSDLTSKFDEKTVINKDYTLYAKWDDNVITVVQGISRPLYYNTFLNNKKEKDNKRIEFSDLSKNFYVGDDNAWNVYPNISFLEINLLTMETKEVKVSEWEFDIKVYELFEQSETLLENDSDLIENIDSVNCLIDFSSSAIGKTFRVEITPKMLTDKQKDNIEDYIIKLEGTVIDGYNVTSALELAYFENRFASSELLSKYDEAKAWKEFREEKGLDLELFPNNIILHSDINIKASDMPSMFFYTKEEVLESDADYDRVVGSMKDFYEIYCHYTYDNDEFHCYGNYYSINSKDLKEVVRESGKITAEGEVTSHATLFSFRGNENGSTYFEDTNFVGNAPKVENAVKSGGIILLRTSGPAFKAINNISSCFFITYFAEYAFEDFIMEKCKAYDNFTCFVYNFGSPKVTIKDCEMIDAGGPVIIQDHVEPNNDGGKIGETVVINSKLESFVTGEEGWFNVVKATQYATAIKSLDVIFNTVGRSFLKRGQDDQSKVYFNFICANKEGGDNVMISSSKIKGSLKIDDCAAFDFGKTNPYLSAMLDQTYALQAPAFQSSNATLEKGYGYTDLTNLYDVTQAPIQDPTNPIFYGDYLCIYYQGMAFTMGFYNLGETYTKAN